MSSSKPWAVAMKQTSSPEARSRSSASFKAYALLPPRAPPRSKISRPPLLKFSDITFYSLMKQPLSRPICLDVSDRGTGPSFPSGARLGRSVDSLHKQVSRAVVAGLRLTQPGQVEGYTLTSLRKCDCYG